MKGLLIKDINFLKGQKQFFGILAIMMIVFIFSYSNFAFVISYVTIMFSVLVITTMSYDDYENGMCYLLSLPVSRKQYVTEKYIFSILSILSGLVSVLVIVIVAAAVKRSTLMAEEIMPAVAASILIAALMVGVTLPIQLKFGAEKSRIALMGVFGAGFLGAYAVVKICETAGIDVMAFLDSIFIDNLMTTVGGAIVLGGVFLVVSYMISVKIMVKKEF